ncbi:unnamed protein product [Acanthoscelides obtectus]|uniref:SUN domain-containing protein n=2 Tax=Acanthoscelides obtectus TaxID=200917 RepID=A0A9P0JIY8_ACAOB|nr:unnamed protein product [Acanthoscelides obtectus]CAK1639830.1 SUN domain-containing protein 2 [Acanthoscelides obtectus]
MDMQELLLVLNCITLNVKMKFNRNVFFYIIIYKPVMTMDDISSRTSDISIVDEEARSEASHTGINLPYHNHNTRFSAKFRKALYVDLSRSRITSEPQNTTFEEFWSLVKYKRRDSDGFSKSSREFNFDEDYSLRLCKDKKISDMPSSRRICGGGLENSWLKYVIAFCIVGVSYTLMNNITTSETVRALFRELRTFKEEIQTADYPSKMYRIENTLMNMKREQDLYMRSLNHKIVEALETYSSDKTGRADYALEAGGGKVVSLLHGTENFERAKTLFGITLCEGTHGPGAMLHVDMSPGHCWAIKGSQGGAIIKLIGRVKVNAVSMEHISKNISPTGEVSSAPKEFGVWGMRNAKDRGVRLGTFTYDSEGGLVQTFSIANDYYFDHVQLEILSNQGNPEYTCIYSILVCRFTGQSYRN